MSDLSIVHTDGAPRAIGPYSQAVKANGFLFASGQIPMDPETGELVEGSVGDQTHRVFKNLEAVLKEAGTSLDRVVKTTCFLADMNDFAEMNGVYAEYFGDHRPARATVQAGGLPKNVGVEIEVIALLD